MSTLRAAAGLLRLAPLLVAACGQLAPSGPKAPEERIRELDALGIAAERILGPYDNLDQYCKEIKDAAGSPRCGDVVEEIEDVEAPFEAVQVLRVQRPADGVTNCEIAVATAAGWSVSERLFICGERGSEDDVEFEITNLELVWQRDDNPIIRIEVRLSEQDGNTVLVGEELALCGVGDSGNVSCTPSFSRLEHIIHDNGEEEHRAASMTLSRFGVLKINGDGFVDGDVVDITGAYRVRFP
ncbi:MAG TPA: hypothetical protein VML75_06685 [Kofleriaceae bacterium]|nr:hypothetical protein [Kofleriaceae bacterium]